MSDLGRLIPLKNKRDEPLNALLISGVLIRELIQQYLFLVTELDPKTKESEGDTEESDTVPRCQRGTNYHRQQAGIDRMANKAVRSALNELVLFFQSNGAAPIPAEGQTRPDRKDKAHATQTGRSPRDKRIRGQTK